MQCLWHAIKPKDYVQKIYPSVTNTWESYGVMESLKCDNALEFGGDQLEDIGLQLGFVVEFTPPKMPWYKACVERQHGMWNTMLLNGQPGSFLKSLKEYADEYDPHKNAVITLDGLHEMIHILIVDIISQMSHPRLGTPRSEVWRAATAEYPPALPFSSKDLRTYPSNNRIGMN